MRYILISLFFVLSCTPKKAELQNFSFTDFNKDKLGCLNIRGKQEPELIKQKDLFLGLSQQELTATLGKFDVQVLSTRSQKVYIYFLEKGPQCSQIQEQSMAKTIAFEINSVGLVKEVLFQKGIPY